MDKERLTDELDFLIGWEKSLIEDIDKKSEYLKKVRVRILKIRERLNENS